MTNRTKLVLATVGACLALPGGAWAGAGDLDTAFSTDGYEVFSSLDESDDSPNLGAVASVPQPGGGTLVVGAVASADLDQDGNPVVRLALLRLDAAGEPDPAYGTNGLALVPAAAGTEAIDAVALGDGDIAVLAAFADPHGAYAVSRVNPDATLDPSFSGDGVVVTGYSAFQAPDIGAAGYSMTGRSLALVGADRLVVGAQLQSYSNQAQPSSYSYAAGVAAYAVASGELDPAFGTNGTTLLEPPAGYQSFGSIRDIAAEPVGGRILVLEELSQAGATRSAVHRLDDDGAPDPSFGDDGLAIVRFRPDLPDASESTSAVSALPDGGVAVAGYVAEQAAVARLDDAGQADGVVLVDGGQAGTRAFEALAVIDGVLYAAGRNVDIDAQSNYGPSESWLVRLDDTFAIDPAFGTNGIARGGDLDFVNDLVGTADGFAVVSGASAGLEDNSWAVARYDLRDSRQPVSAAAPTVSAAGGDSANAGDVVTADDGRWHYGDVITRRWQRCDTQHPASAPATASDCADIASQTGTTYTATAADKGKHLRVIVTNTSGTFAATAAAATIEVLDPAQAPAFTSGPTVSPAGSVPAGSDVRATWTASGTPTLVAEVRWFHCPTATTGPCQPVPADDATDDRYTTTTADVGKFLRAAVTLTGPGGTATEQTANATGVTAVSTQTAPQATTPPAITPAGSVTVGTTLARSSDGTWDQADLTFSYRWERCVPDGGACTTIPGAGTASYATGSADVGRQVRLVVDARKGDGPIGSASSAATTVVAQPAPVVTATPSPTPVTPAFVVTDSTSSAKMPDVRGLKVDAAKDRIAKAGIYGAIDVRETIRKTPKKLAGKTLDIGDVSAQSLAPGTAVVSSVGVPKPIRIVTEAGAKATPATGGPLGPVCTGAAVRGDLKGLELGEVFDLLQAKRCTKLDANFTVSRGAKELEVRRATKGDGTLELTIVVPGDPQNLDLTPIFRQGAFNNRPSFDEGTWSLTADAVNILGIQTVSRANLTVDGAQVLIDGSKVGADDLLGKANGGVYVHGFEPTRPGVVNVLVQQEDAEGNALFGFGRFTVRDRKAGFTGIDGRSFTAQGAPTTRASATGIKEVLAYFGELANRLGLGGLFTGPITTGTITTAAKQSVGVVQISLGDPLSADAGKVTATKGSVIAAGGGNAVASGGANVIAAGGGNMISVAKGTAVASGGANAIGETLIKNGTGKLIPILTEAVASGGANAVASGGANVIAPDGKNVIAGAAENLISDNGLGIISDNGLGRSADTVFAVAAAALTPKTGTFKAPEGQVQRGYDLRFQVDKKGKRISNLVAHVLESCDGSSTSSTTTVGPGLTWKVANGRFSGREKESADGVTLYTTLEGRFTSPTRATGTVRQESIVAGSACDTLALEFTARR